MVCSKHIFSSPESTIHCIKHVFYFWKRWFRGSLRRVGSTFLQKTKKHMKQMWILTSLREMCLLGTHFIFVKKVNIFKFTFSLSSGIALVFFLKEPDFRAVQRGQRRFKCSQTDEFVGFLWAPDWVWIEGYVWGWSKYLPYKRFWDIS